jgi:hypothetical protein
MSRVFPPALVPALSREGWDDGLPDLVVATSMAQGPPKLRRATTAGVRDWDLTVQPITTAERMTLEGFYLTTCAGGALDFEISHPALGTRNVQFKPHSPPRFAILGAGWWRATLSLQILP